MRDIIAAYAQKGQKILPAEHSFVVAQDGALLFMNAVVNSYGQSSREDVELTPDEDELFRFRDIKVRLRVRGQIGSMLVMRHEEIWPMTCCDITAYKTVAMAISRGNS